MSRRSLQLTIALCLVIFPAAALLAQEDLRQPEVQNSNFQYQGNINADSVYIRGGPGENFYATQKMEKGATVTVVGIKFDWLKIVPPDGSFCYVAKAFIEKRGDGNTGRVTKPDVYVRAGSVLYENLKTAVQTRLNVGDDVTILGEADSYFKIKPPTGAYLYVNKQFVDPVKPVGSAATTPPANTAVTSAANPAAPPAGTVTGSAVNAATGAAAAETLAVHTPATAPSLDVVAVPVPTTQPDRVAAAPATQPAPELTLDQKMAALQAEFDTISAKPLEEQPVEQLGKKYEAIANDPGLNDTLKRMVAIRVATLKSRADSKAKLTDVHRIEQEAAAKQKASDGELADLQEQHAKAAIEIYAAVGTVQPSSLQLATGGTLYRLTDPANGRTVIYVRSPDNKLSSQIGQFVGVKGEAQTDPQLPLRIITPTAVQTMDMTQVTNNKVAAQIIPPSLLKGSTPTSSAN